MAYKRETIKNLMVKARDIRKHYENMDPESIAIAISNGNRKIGKVMNVSMMPVMTCGNCKECKAYCYDIKACLQYRNVIDARIRNTVLATKYRDKYFSDIRKRIAKRTRNFYFRWHVSGDILDMDYFREMVAIARENPHFVFWTYTKMYRIVNAYCDIYGRDSIPGNFVVMFSKWDGLKMDNPYNFPVFACKLKDGNKDYIPFETYYKCPGNCDKCKEANRGCIHGENTYANEH